MYRFSIAFVCAVFACQAGLADSRPPFLLTKANINDEQFRHDRKECSAKATEAVGQWSEISGAPIACFGGGTPATGPVCMYSPPTHYISNVHTEHDYHTFLRCMLAKGYQESLPPMPVGKAGLYELRKFSNSGMFVGRDLSNTLPYTQRRASADALARPGPVFQLCVPQDGAQQLGTVAGLSSSCTYSNIVSTPHGFTADASCHGGQSIHVTFEAATPERREFAVIGQPVPKAVVPHIDKYQVNWISTDCGGIPPGSVRTPEGKLVPMANPKATK